MKRVSHKIEKRRSDFWCKVVQTIYNYILFFLMVAFLVTCSMMSFVSVLSETLEIEFTEQNLNMAAKLTFANVVFLSILFTVLDALRRKFTTEKVTNHIVNAAKKVVQGDFDVRITEVNKFGTDNKFNEIIDCFNKMTQELAGVETLRTDFMANVSHEMKTPLTVIQNYGTLMQAKDLDEAKRIEYAKGITDATRRLSDMMTNILKLNRLEKQQIYSNTETYNLSEQLCECMLDYEIVWERKNIDIETLIDDDIKVNADRELLTLVWNNLFSNAFKFTPEGGKVSVVLKKDGEYVVVKVIDTGCGMSQEVGEHIFEKFYQGDSSHQAQGNGLGLALVKRVVDILHGEISVESTIGEGSTFIVRFKSAE